MIDEKRGQLMERLQMLLAEKKYAAGDPQSLKRDALLERFKQMKDTVSDIPKIEQASKEEDRNFTKKTKLHSRSKEKRIKKEKNSSIARGRKVETQPIHADREFLLKSLQEVLRNEDFAKELLQFYFLSDTFSEWADTDCVYFGWTLCCTC